MLQLLRWGRLSGDEDGTGSLLFAIGQALDRVREAPRSDEALALAANRIVRRCLDKHAITYKEYREWRRRNPLIFTSIVDEFDRMIGFFDIFPLWTEPGEDIIAGRMTERSLRAEHLIPLADIGAATHLHIATIFLNPRQRAFSRIVAKEVLLLKMRDFLEAHFAPVGSRTYSAFAQSRSGELLLKRCGFSVAVLASQNEHHWPLYVLRPDETGAAIFRFDRADEYFSGKAALKKLDARIEIIEIALRTLISDAVDGDPSRLPPHVNQKVDERLRSEAHKNAAFNAVAYRKLPARLEFCDLRELQDTLLSRQLWPLFEPRFANKESLVAKFGQMAGLRNVIRHSRSVDEVTQMEGEAGIIWFERVIAK